MASAILRVLDTTGDIPARIRHGNRRAVHRYAQKTTLLGQYLRTLSPEYESGLMRVL